MKTEYRLLPVVFALLAPVVALAGLEGVTMPHPADGAIARGVDAIADGQIPHMVTSRYNPISSYSFEFVYGSKDISDGSDFGAVRNAFQTWVDLPDSAVSFREGGSRNRPSLGATNGRNEVTWVSAERFGANAWTDTLDLSPSAIAVAFTWYYAGSGRVVEQDIYFNDIYMDWRTDSDGAENGGFNVQHIALHEIGHIFGLKDVYNPGQPGYESWMGDDNEDLTMYGYSRWYYDDITLAPEDIAALALLHPDASYSAVPEPMSLLLLAAGGLLLRSRRGR